MLKQPDPFGTLYLLTSNEDYFSPPKFGLSQMNVQVCDHKVCGMSAKNTQFNCATVAAFVEGFRRIHYFCFLKMYRLR